MRGRRPSSAARSNESSTTIATRHDYVQAPSRFRRLYAPSALTQLNNGETIEVRSDLAQTLFVGDKPYSLVQFHFHSPAEHPVAGAVEPLEIHFVHQAADGERAVLGAL